MTIYPEAIGAVRPKTPWAMQESKPWILATSFSECFRRSSTCFVEKRRLFASDPRRPFTVVSPVESAWLSMVRRLFAPRRPTGVDPQAVALEVKQEFAASRLYSGSPVGVEGKQSRKVAFSSRKSHLARDLKPHANWRTALIRLNGSTELSLLVGAPGLCENPMKQWK
jgi:hypothetical protein